MEESTTLSDLNENRRQISKLRSELRNIRQQLETQKQVHKKDLKQMKDMLEKCQKGQEQQGLEKGFDSRVGHKRLQEGTSTEDSQDLMFWKPIGYLKSVFTQKNGTPRQSGICENAKAQLTIGRTIFNNPSHSLEGLEDFSHVWVFFIFHQNNNQATKSKVKPPRLNGDKKGLFATRCPYRPNAIGLTLAKLESIQGNTIFMSGVDILDGTPILDIKPYIPDYDMPPEFHQSLSERNGIIDIKNVEAEYSDVPCEDPVSNSVQELADSESSDTTQELEEEEIMDGSNSQEPDMVNSSDTESVRQSENKLSIASWILKPPIDKIKVRFTGSALEQIEYFDKKPKDDLYLLNYLSSSADLKTAIKNVLKADPRSSYRRKRCQDRLYYFSVDKAHVTCWFDDFNNVAEVLKVDSIDVLQKSGTNIDKLELKLESRDVLTSQEEPLASQDDMM